jgi:MoxR-like ATPase
MNVTQALESVEIIKTEFRKLLVGQQEMVDLMLVAILADGHLLLEGVPGVAKTLAAKVLAKTIEADFSRIQFTPDLMPSDVLGTLIFNAKTLDFEFRKGPIFSNIVLIDEINRAPAKTQAALFEVMEERQITIDGVSHLMVPPFLVIATQNPIEQEGTYRLPEAQLDRFLFKVEVKYPSLEEEIMILNTHHQQGNKNDLSLINAVLSPEILAGLRQLVQEIHVEPKIMTYIATIIQETRRSGDLFLGASPRASVSLLNASKAFAVLRGREFVTPEDVKYMTHHVLRHRIVLTPEKEMEGFSPDDIITKLTDKVEVPR